MKLRFSLVALIAANMVPLIGGLFFDWNVTLVLALFWIENLIIGAFNLLKMVMVVVQQRAFRDVFQCVFFVVHYGMFCIIHGSILWEILDLGKVPEQAPLSGSSFILIDLLNDGVATFNGFISLFEPTIWFGILALAFSRLASFIEHFILRGEIFELTVPKLMTQPYGQILVMHFGLIFGAFAIQIFGSPLWLLVVIMAFKIMVDSTQHNGRHRDKTDSKLDLNTAAD